MANDQAETSPPVGFPTDTKITRNAWLALAVATLTTFLVVIDISAVNVAFPSIQDDFEVSRTSLSWVVSSYNIVVGALLLSAGRLADSIGRRKVFLPGVALFGIGSALCGIAPNHQLLIAARVVQAVGGAVTMASSFAVMLPEFHPSKRSTAIGIAGATGSLGAVAGPALGSALIDLFNWRAIFLINVPLCLLVLVLGPKWLSESSDPDATGRIDLLGVAIGTAGVFLVMFGIVQSETWGISDPRAIAAIVLGMVLLPLLIRRSRTHPEPLINLELFEYASFRSVNTSVVFYGLAFTSGFLVNSLVLQDLWGQSIRTTGLALMPSPLIAAIASPISGSVADRIGHRWVLSLGTASLGLCYLLYVLLLGPEPQVWTHFVPISLISGLGVGTTVATWSSAGVADIPPAKFGVAGATFNTLRQASYALGIAVTVTLVASGTSELDFTGYQRAWMFVAASYFVAAAVVGLTFPSGSSHDRATAR